MGLDLGKQVGPLPVGAWVAVVGGGLLIGYYFSKGSADKANDEAASGPLTEPGVGQGGGQFIYEPPTSVETPNSDPQTNAEWGRKAINWLIAEGYDAGVSQAAVTKFLTGQNRSLHEQTLINLALIKFGSPPEEVPLPEGGTPTIPKPPAPKPPTPKPPTSAHKPYFIHTVRAGDSPTKILKHYPYIKSWWVVYVANDKLGLRPDGSKGVMSNPYDLKPRTRLIIPGVATPAAATQIRGPKAGAPLRWHTVQARETLTAIGKKYGVHPWVIYTANDVVGMRANGSKGILLAMGVKPGQRLIIPYV